MMADIGTGLPRGLIATLIVLCLSAGGARSAATENGANDWRVGQKSTLTDAELRTKLNAFHAETIRLCQERRYERAVAFMRREIEQADKAHGPHSDVVLWYLFDACMTLEICGRYEEVEPFYKRILASIEAMGMPEAAAVPHLISLGLIYGYQDKHAEAEPLYERALTIMDEAEGPTPPYIFGALNNLARTKIALKKYDEAEALVLRAQRIQKSQQRRAAPSYQTIQYLNMLAEIHEKQGRPSEAEPFYLEALELTRITFGQDPLDVATCHHNLARVYHAQKKYAKAEAAYQREIALKQERLGTDCISIISCLENLAALYRDMGRNNEAKALDQRAAKIRAENKELLKAMESRRSTTSATSIATPPSRGARAAPRLAFHGNVDCLSHVRS